MGIKKLDKLKLKEFSDKLWQYHIDIGGIYDEYAKSVGLTSASFIVLCIIYEKKCCTQKLISKNTYLPKQTINAIIKAFVKQGILEHPVELNSDKRNKIIKFTEKGQLYAEQIISKVKQADYRVLDSLGEERCEQLLEIIGMYKNNLKIE